MKYLVGDKVTTKKVHPCGNNVWTIVRTGADIKIKCDKCGRTIIFPLSSFDKIIKNFGDNSIKNV